MAEVTLIGEVSRAAFPTRFGTFEVFGFENQAGPEQSIAVVKGFPLTGRIPLVRIHSQCLTGDALHSLRCDCGEQLERALLMINESGCGVVIYQLQEGRGIGLLNKLRAYQLQDQGADTVEANHRLGFAADLRSYQLESEILKYFGVSSVRLLSNNPTKITALVEAGIEVSERIPLVVEASDMTAGYLRTKKEKMGHLLD